jgi:hypothetical protein
MVDLGAVAGFPVFFLGGGGPHVFVKRGLGQVQDDQFFLGGVNCTKVGTYSYYKTFD